MSFTTSDGRKLTYRTIGHGPLLVCHPGGPGFSAADFSDLAALWEQYTLIMLNPRGTGGSKSASQLARLPDPYAIATTPPCACPSGETSIESAAPGA